MNTVARSTGGRNVVRGRANKTVASFADDQLCQIKPPTLLLWGDADLTLPLTYALKAQTLIPNTQLQVFPGAGHFPYIEQPQAFSEAVVPFLQAG